MKIIDDETLFDPFSSDKISWNNLLVDARLFIKIYSSLTFWVLILPTENW